MGIKKQIDPLVALTQSKLGLHVSGKGSRAGKGAFSKGTGGGSAVLLDGGGSSGMGVLTWKTKGSGPAGRGFYMLWGKVVTQPVFQAMAPEPGADDLVAGEIPEPG